MATRYWIGNGGSWTDTAHWSTTSGGAGGASVPGISDAVIIDDNGITTTGQTITVSGIRNCASFTSTSTKNPTISLTGSSMNTLTIWGNADFTGTTWTALATQNVNNGVRFRGTGAVTITTGGSVLPLCVFNNGGAGDVTYTLSDNFSVMSGQLTIFKSTDDSALVNFVAGGKTLNLPRVILSNGQTDTFDNCTINITESFVSVFASIVSNGTVWNITCPQSAITISTDDPVLSPIIFDSSSSFTFHSDEGFTLNRATVRNSNATSTTGPMKVIIFPEDPPGTGDGGGNSGWTFIRAHIQSPPTRVVTPPSFPMVADRVLTPPTKPGA